MKAIYTTGQGSYGLAERPKPEPAGDEALVRVAAAGLCPNEARLRHGLIKAGRYPVVPGHQFAGVVESCGPVIKHINPGDKVAVHPYVVCGECSVCRGAGPTQDCERYLMLGSTLDGGLAEYCAVPARHLYKLPDHVTVEEGALIENLANAVAAARNAELQVGERVVVIGAWSVAMLALQVARRHNPGVLALVGTGPQRLAIGKRLGATHTVDLDEEDAGERLSEALDRRGADVVLMCGTTLNELELAMEAVATGGRIVVEGHFDPEVTVTFSPFGLLVARSVTLRANRGFTTPDYTRAYQMLLDGIVDMKSLITSRFQLEDWESAFEAFSGAASQTVQVLVTP